MACRRDVDARPLLWQLPAERRNRHDKQWRSGAARCRSVPVDVAGVTVGGPSPVVVQSMTNTDTADVDGTAQQVAALARQGSELVRITVDRDEAAAAVPHIKDKLLKMNVDVPIVGGFHYIGHKLLADHQACAEALDKYRINPGNVGFKERRTASSARSSRPRSSTASRCGSAPTGARSTRSCSPA